MGDLRFEQYFLYTQHSLATFNKCPLKFKKKYLEGLKWETFPDESVRLNIKRGLDFHLLANRYFMGIDAGMWKDTEEYGDINGFYESLLKNFTIKQDTLYLPEFKLRITEDVMKIEANYDLILVEESHVYIYDWKTRSSNRELQISKTREKLTNSLQTIVYMYVLAEQIRPIYKLYENKFNKRIENPDKFNITMLYWMPEEPFELARISYSQEKHEVYQTRILNNINEIMNYGRNGNEELSKQHCKFCEFNWFCNNEKVNFEAIEESDEFLEDFDWDDID